MLNSFHEVVLYGSGPKSQSPTQVIVTSWLFPSGMFSIERLQELSSLVGPEHVVVDLSCRRKGTSWNVAINRWQTVTDMEVNQGMVGVALIKKAQCNTFALQFF